MKLGFLNKFINKFTGGQLPVDVEQKANHVHREVFFIYTAPHGGKTVRTIKGKLINDFAIDYSKPLSEIKEEVEQLLDFWIGTYSDEVIKQIGMFPKSGEIAVYEGGNHIDIILQGKGSLGWLTVADHYASKLNSN